MLIWHYTFSSPEKAVGGVEKHILGMTRALAKRGVSTHIGPDRPNIQKHQQVFFHTHGDCWPNPMIFSLKIKLRGAFTWIQTCHGTSVGRVLACKEYISLSGLRGSVRDFSLIRSANAAIAVSPKALTEAKKYFGFTGPSAVISNGADPKVFYPLSEISQNPYLIFIGRTNDRVKNISCLLEASRMAHQINPEFQLRISPGLTPKTSEEFVKNTGPKYGQELREQMAQSRALVLCSFYEGNPLVLHEAKAMGLPVIVSDLPQLRYLMGNYKNTFWINPRSSDSLFQQIKRVVLDKPQINVEPQIRSWDQAAEEVLSFYETLKS